MQFNFFLFKYFDIIFFFLECIKIIFDELKDNKLD